MLFALLLLLHDVDLALALKKWNKDGKTKKVWFPIPKT